MEEIKHNEMVAGLAKSGQAIIDEMTPESMHSLHMSVGIAGESSELIEAVFNVSDFEMVDKENMLEELGDCEFYIEGLRQGFDIKREETLAQVEAMNDDVVDHTGNMPDLKQAIVGLAMDSGKLLDAIKKVAFYVKAVDIEKTTLNLADIEAHLFIIRTVCGFTHQECLDHNVAKLGERYEGHQYSNEQANERADKKD